MDREIPEFQQGANLTVLYKVAIIGDTIVSASWATSPATGVNISPVVGSGVFVTALVSGLTSGTTYTLTATLTCASGQILEGVAKIVCP